MKIRVRIVELRRVKASELVPNPANWRTHPKAQQDALKCVLSEDRAEELRVKWGVEPGQLWVIGGHRLLVGDSTKAEDVGRVMGGEKAAACVTSPPYNLGNDHHTGDKKTQAYHDALPENDYQALQRSVLSLVAFAVSGDCFYQHKNRIHKKRWITPLDWIRDGEWQVVQEVVWINGGPNMDPCRFYPQTERIYWLTRNGSKTIFSNDEHLTDWWQIAPVGTDGAHTRAYPVEIPARLIRASNADSVYDPFLGSGTTMVAAQNLGRRCFGIEISPAYCAFILERMAAAFPDLDIYQKKC